MRIFPKPLAAAAVTLMSMLLLFTFCGEYPIGPPSGDGNYTYTGKTVTIGGKTWMAENLNRKTRGSFCYDNDNSNCDKYGRLYTWNAAMSACPSGWHLPSRSEWNNLESAVGSNAGKKLKSKTGWNSGGNGTDDYGFSALPGGFRGYLDHGGSFVYAGSDGKWWSATESDGSYAYNRNMYYNYDRVYEGNLYKSDGYSVRCVSDD